MKVFFIPYAGGRASSYYILKKHLDSQFKVFLVELCGRGKRKDEPFYKDMNEAAEDVFNEIKDNIDDEPYAIFGHSMGGLIIYELLDKIRELDMSYPKHIFISARRAPHLKPLYGKKYYKLPDREFIHELQKMGDINKIFAENYEIFKAFSPVIRSDYKLVEEYVFAKPIKKFKCNMTLLYSIEDVEASEEEVLQWKEYNDNGVDYFEFNGGHFYIFSNLEKVSNVINNTLYQYIN